VARPPKPRPKKDFEDCCWQGHSDVELISIVSGRKQSYTIQCKNCGMNVARGSKWFDTGASGRCALGFHKPSTQRWGDFFERHWFAVYGHEVTNRFRLVKCERCGLVVSAEFENVDRIALPRIESGKVIDGGVSVRCYDGGVSVRAHPILDNIYHPDGGVSVREIDLIVQGYVYDEYMGSWARPDVYVRDADGNILYRNSVPIYSGGDPFFDRIYFDNIYFPDVSAETSPKSTACSYCGQDPAPSGKPCPGCGYVNGPGRACSSCGIKRAYGHDLCPGCGNRMAETSRNPVLVATARAL